LAFQVALFGDIRQNNDATGAELGRMTFNSFEAILNNARARRQAEQGVVTEESLRPCPGTWALAERRRRHR
jgi:hypothetical protein